MKIRGIFAAVLLLALGACSTAPDRAQSSDRGLVAVKDSTATKVEWQTVTAPASCQCADGSEFKYFIRRANPKKVLFFLHGGGACFSRGTCGPENPTYARNIDPKKGLPSTEGLFEFDNPKNPLADYSVVDVPYCTGDVHLGNSSHDYGEGVVVKHNGFVNASTAMASMATAFPDATEVVVAGASAGSAGVPLYAGMVKDVLPTAKVSAIADGSGAYPPNPVVTKAIGSLWGTDTNRPRWKNAEPSDTGDWSLPGLFIQSTLHNPEINWIRINFAYDGTQQQFTALSGTGGDDLAALIDSNLKHVTDKGVKVADYLAPGVQHTIISDDSLYKLDVNGTKLIDWLTGALARKPTPNVHCTQCK